MTLKRAQFVLYLLVCMAIGLVVSRRVLGSVDEYWIAGQRISTGVNAVATMAALASGGPIIGVVGRAYGRGIPFALSPLADIVVGFPLASILVARPLRNFGRFATADFLAYHYPHAAMRGAVPLLIVASFTVYIVAQMKAAGTTAELLLGIPYNPAVRYGLDCFLPVCVDRGNGGCYVDGCRPGSAHASRSLQHCVRHICTQGDAHQDGGRGDGAGAYLGEEIDQPLSSYLGLFVIWAAAIPAIPHIAMRVYSARDARSAHVSLNVAMVAFSAVLLSAVLAIIPYGAAAFPGITDLDTIFLHVMEEAIPPLVCGLAVAAFMAVVMSTTDALLLASSSAIAHDLMGHQSLGRWGVSASIC